jgi:hypothetical protein
MKLDHRNSEGNHLSTIEGVFAMLFHQVLEHHPRIAKKEAKSFEGSVDDVFCYVIKSNFNWTPIENGITIQFNQGDYVKMIYQ